MSLQEFEYILKQVKHITPYIYLHVQGEPLLHKDFDSILTLCDTYQMMVQLVTNGIELQDHMSILDHPSLRKVSISIQSIEYSNIDVNTYMQTIESFIKTASRQKLPFCELRFWRDDQKEMERTKACWNFLNDRHPFEATSRKENFQILNHVYVDFNHSFNWPDIHKNNESEKGTCHGALQQIAILSNGTVTACCLDANGEISFGNIFETPLNQILLSDRYLNMCKALKNHILIEPLCQKCTFHKQFD